MDGSRSKRISQKGKCRETQVDGLLEKAEAFARGVLESVQALAGTTICKGVQIARLTPIISHPINWATKSLYPFLK